MLMDREGGQGRGDAHDVPWLSNQADQIPSLAYLVYHSRMHQTTKTLRHYATLHLLGPELCCDAALTPPPSSPAAI